MAESCDEVEFDRSAELHIVVTRERVRISVQPADPQLQEDEGVSALRTRPSEPRSQHSG